MPYKIRYHKEAKAELNKCRPLYDPKVFWNQLNKWLRLLATEAKSKQWTLSTDLESLLQGGEEVEQLVKQWPNALRQFWKAGFAEKLKAAYLILTARAPYQARSAVETFKIFFVDNEVTALYLINHAAEEIIFMAFEGLPLQGYD